MSARRERVSGYRRIEPAALYTLGSVAASVGAYMLLTLPFALLPRDVRFVTAAIALGLALIWHAADLPFTKLAGHGRQSNRRLAFAGRWGRVYFGAILGVGVATHMTTPLVYAGLLLAASQGPVWALLAGVGFGLGRAIPALAAPVIGTNVSTPAAVTRFLLGHSRAARAVGVAVSGVGLAVVIGTWR